MIRTYRGTCSGSSRLKQPSSHKRFSNEGTVLLVNKKFIRPRRGVYKNVGDEIRSPLRSRPLPYSPHPVKKFFYSPATVRQTCISSGAMRLTENSGRISLLVCWRGKRRAPGEHNNKNKKTTDFQFLAPGGGLGLTRRLLLGFQRTNGFVFARARDGEPFDSPLWLLFWFSALVSFSFCLSSTSTRDPISFTS